MGKPREEIRRRWKIDHRLKVQLLLIAYDVIAIAAVYLFALFARFDFVYSAIPPQMKYAYLRFIPIYCVVCVLVFRRFRLYRSIWRFASFMELERMIGVTVITGIFHAVAMHLFITAMPVSYYVFGIILQFLATLGIRFMYRFILLLRATHGERAYHNRKNVMLIGAGAAGNMIYQDLKSAKESQERVCCFIDDNRNKWEFEIDGVPIVGGREKILSACKQYQIEKIYLAIPSASAESKRDILNICKEANCEIMTLPGMYQIYNGEVSVSNMRKVEPEDLLGRKPIQTNMEEVYQFLQGKVILVTSVGSIGSELCRQIAAHSPKQLILFDIFEYNAYSIQMELLKNFPDLDVQVCIGSVRDSRKLFRLFEVYRPEIVYHAAAHKHVPLMEGSPCEAIKNNAIGTYKTAYAAMAYGCKRFVLVSTDKAVNPTNIMGASKRLCEMVIQAFDHKIKEGKADEIPQLFTHEILNDVITKPEVLKTLKTTQTEFVAVRFGNVLGSSGSVIPLFKSQIERGGPVTVTHPDIIRYFMTIPEAVSLILQAGTYAKGGEIFVLDMGDPVKIDTLARNLIRLSGYEPDVDIKIQYTGLRPGEKLFEEKLMAEEGLKKTENDLIFIGCPIPFDINIFLKKLGGLMNLAYRNRDKEIRASVQEIVSTYHPS